MERRRPGSPMVYDAPSHTHVLRCTDALWEAMTQLANTWNIREGKQWWTPGRVFVHLGYQATGLPNPARPS